MGTSEPTQSYHRRTLSESRQVVSYDDGGRREGFAWLIRLPQRHIEQNHPKDRLILPGEFAYSALLHRRETGGLLCRCYWIRFPVQTAGRTSWICAYWRGEQLDVYFLDDSARDFVASGSVRAAS